MSRQCPDCHARVSPRASQCVNCGTLLPIEEDRPRRRRRDDVEGSFDRGAQSWGSVAAVIVYVLVLLPLWVLFGLANMRPDPTVKLVDRVVGTIGGPLFLAAFPAAAAWLIVDCVQASWNWLWAPRGPQTTWATWWGGPGRLGLIALSPWVGAAVGLFVAPLPWAQALMVGGFWGAVAGLGAATAVSAILHNLS
jgi:hypothetical protein